MGWNLPHSKISWPYVLGFVVGFVISLKILLIGLGHKHIAPPTLIENRNVYLEDMTSSSLGFTYRCNFNHWTSNTTHEEPFCQSESEFLRATSPTLCFMIENDTNQIPYIETALSTFATLCDKMVIFHISPSLSTRLLSSNSKISLEMTTFYFISESNSTMKVLINSLSHLNYTWYVYVPHSVYLVPTNLEYYLMSSLANPDAVWFIGKIVSSWSGPYALSNGAPFIMSKGAVRKAEFWLKYHLDVKITDFQGMVQGCQGVVHELVSSDQMELFCEHKVHEYYILRVNPESKLPVFPVSIYVGANQYKPILDLHFYISKLKPYGLTSSKGPLGRSVVHSLQ